MTNICEKKMAGNDLKRLQDKVLILQGGKAKEREWRAILSLLTTVYYNAVNIDPNFLGDAQQDQIVFCSEDHSLVLWTILEDIECLQAHELSKILKMEKQRSCGNPISQLPGIEYVNKDSVEAILVGIGLALAAKLENSERHTYVILDSQLLFSELPWKKLLKENSQKLNQFCLMMNYRQDEMFCSQLTAEEWCDRFDRLGFSCICANVHDVQKLTDVIFSTVGQRPLFICCVEE